MKNSVLIMNVFYFVGSVAFVLGNSLNSPPSEHMFCMPTLLLSLAGVSFIYALLWGVVNITSSDSTDYVDYEEDEDDDDEDDEEGKYKDEEKEITSSSEEED